MTPLPAILSLTTSTTQPMLRVLSDRTNWTHWTILLVGIFVGVVAGRIASAVITGIAKRLAAREWGMRSTIIAHMAGPANLALVTVGLNLGLFPLFAALRAADPSTDPYRPMIDGVNDFFVKVVRLLFTLALAWFLFNLVDTVDFVLKRLAAKTESKLDDQLAPLVRKTLRIFVIVVFALFIAQNVFGADITAWLAGLGIAGLAVSLAAQDSIKNLFGSITIFMDHPFGVGDSVKVADYEGTVEEIGFRSTKLRGPTGNLVSIPNSKIVDGAVENVSRRPNIRRILDLELPQEAPADKVLRAVEIIRGILAEPEFAAPFRNLEKFPPRVYFDDIGQDTLRVRVMYWYYPSTDPWGYADHLQRLLLRIVADFAREGIELATPTRHVILKPLPHAG